MKTAIRFATAVILSSLSTAGFAAQGPKKETPATPAAPATAPRSADPRTEALVAWLEGFFPWGAGTTTVEEISQVKVPGYRVVVAKKKFTLDERANDQLYAALDESGKTALLGDIFADEERMKAPVPVRGDGDLDAMRNLLKKYFRTGFKVTLDPASDRKGWKAVVIKGDSGYGSYPMSAFLKADDGALLIIGRFWDRHRSAAEQRKEMIKLPGTASQGPADARVTVVEYSDMQCGYCKKRTADWDTLLDKMGKELKIRRYVKAFPLTGDHPWAFRASSAGRCFLDVSNELFFRWKSNVYKRQDDLSVAEVDTFALDFAVANEVPEEKFKACYLGPKANERVLADMAEGFAVRVRSTPTYFIDGVAVSWFSDNVMEEFLRKTYLGGKGLPLPAAPTAKPAAAAKPAGH